MGVVLPPYLEVVLLGAPCWDAEELREMEAVSSLVEESWDGVLGIHEVLVVVCEEGAVLVGSLWDLALCPFLHWLLGQLPAS